MLAGAFPQGEKEMKKKLFLFAVMMIAVMSIFIFSASALDVEGLFAGEVIDLDEDEDLDTARTVLDNGDGTTSIYYTSQIGYAENDNYKTFKFDLTKITDKTYDVGDIIAIEIFEGPKCILKSISTTWTNLKYIKTSSTIDNIEEQAFLSLTKLEIVDMSGSTSATALKAELFKNCSNLKKVILPPNVTSLGQWMFPNCTNLTEIYMPATITTISRNLHLSTTTSNFVIYFTGSYSEEAGSAMQTLITCSNVDASKITCVSASDFDPDKTPETQCTIVYDYSICDAFYNGNHIENEDYDCTTDNLCKICKRLETEALAHVSDVEFVYENGFASVGKKIEGCSNPNCTVIDKVTDVDAIFSALGYSTSSTKDSVSGGYKINTTAYEAYLENGNVLKYGIIIVNPSSFEAGTELMSDGKLNSTKGIQLEMNSPKYSTINCFIHNFDSETLSLQLVMTLYMIDGDGNVTYLQADSIYTSTTKIGTKTFDTISLQGIIGTEQTALLPTNGDEE